MNYLDNAHGRSRRLLDVTIIHFKNINACADVLDRLFAFKLTAGICVYFSEAYRAQACAGPRPLFRVCVRLTFDLKSRRQCRHRPIWPH